MTDPTFSEVTNALDDISLIEELDDSLGVLITLGNHLNGKLGAITWSVEDGVLKVNDTYIRIIDANRRYSVVKAEHCNSFKSATYYLYWKE